MSEHRRGGQPRVAVVGGGPAGIAAARRLRERAGGEVAVTLVQRDGSSEHLPGTLPVALGEHPPNRFVAPINLEGVEVLAGEVSEISARRVRLDGNILEADYVIAAPGLETVDMPEGAGIHAFWSPSEAAAVQEDLRGVSGTIAVVVSSLPYRCPPAPYSLAMQLAAAQRRSDNPAKVLLTTPEEEPLSALGGGVPEFLHKSCKEAGVELHASFVPDLASLESGDLHSERGEELPADVKLVVPSHVKHPALGHLAGEGPLVEVSESYETEEEGLFVVGDTAAAPFPRAADPAEAAGRTAADAALARLGFDEREPHVPQPECYVGHGEGLFSKISLRYPDGPPPAGSAEVTLEGPSRELARGPEEALERFRSLRTG